MPGYLKNPIIRFFLIFFLVFFGWELLYVFYLEQEGSLDKFLINNLVFLTEKSLRLLGYPTFTGTSEVIRTVGIDGTHGLWIGDNCNANVLFALFASLIIAFPGPVKHKLWFVPAGILAIHFINLARIVALCVVVLKAPEYLDLNHDYLFKIVAYILIFLLWYAWVRRFSGLRSKR